MALLRACIGALLRRQFVHGIVLGDLDGLLGKADLGVGVDGPHDGRLALVCVLSSCSARFRSRTRAGNVRRRLLLGGSRGCGGRQAGCCSCGGSSGGAEIRSRRHRHLAEHHLDGVVQWVGDEQDELGLLTDGESRQDRDLDVRHVVQSKELHLELCGDWAELGLAEIVLALLAALRPLGQQVLGRGRHFPQVRVLQLRHAQPLLESGHGVDVDRVGEEVGRQRGDVLGRLGSESAAIALLGDILPLVGERVVDLVDARTDFCGAVGAVDDQRLSLEREPLAQAALAEQRLCAVLPQLVLAMLLGGKPLVVLQGLGERLGHRTADKLGELLCHVLLRALQADLLGVPQAEAACEVEGGRLVGLERGSHGAERRGADGALVAFGTSVAVETRLGARHVLLQTLRAEERVHILHHAAGAAQAEAVAAPVLPVDAVELAAGVIVDRHWRGGKHSLPPPLSCLQVCS
eukprot:m.88417 g.88417  ORF g.88417 m.88417 type:complete len:463 (-) comp15184_c0_seq1:54-1442(-)